MADTMAGDGETLDARGEAEWSETKRVLRPSNAGTEAQQEQISHENEQKSVVASHNNNDDDDFETLHEYEHEQSKKATAGADGDEHDDGGFDMVDDVPITPLSITINEYGTRLGISHQQGFVVYQNNTAATNNNNGSSGSTSSSGTPSFSEVIRYQPSTSFAGIGQMALLFETFYVGCVGGGRKPLAAEHKLLLFSSDQLVKTLTVSDPIKRVSLASNICILLTQTQFVVMNFRGETLIQHPANGGLVSSLSASSSSGAGDSKNGMNMFQRRPPLATALEPSLVAFPDVASGHIKLAQFSAKSPPMLNTSGGSSGDSSVGGSGVSGTGGMVPHIDVSTMSPGSETNCVATQSIDAHTHPLQCLALSVNGLVVASASTKGTLIRVWKTNDGSKVTEVRNSSVPMDIFQLSLSNGDHIACLSGTRLKIFYIGKEPTEEQKKFGAYHGGDRRLLATNEKSYFSSLAKISTYFDSQWACSEADLPDTAFPILHRAAGGRAAIEGNNTDHGDATTGNYLYSNVFNSALSYVTSAYQGGGASSTTQHYTTAGSNDVPGGRGVVCVEDAVRFWWERPALRSAADSSSNSSSPSSDRYKLMVLASESLFMRFEFDAVLGAVHSLSGEGNSGSRQQNNRDE